MSLENPARLRMTRQREIILHLLRELETHPTADELFQLVRQQLPKISLGTVYRNLDVLFEQGLVRKLENSGPQRRYDGRMHPHHHAQCRQCHRLFDVPIEAVSTPTIRLADELGFQLTEYRLELFGVCADCRRTAAPKERKSGRS
ncbi:MAG: transcriptional repressor [Myxococcales bacterium]|nr:transcriptional repressor [Myxococcales bacterium]